MVKSKKISEKKKTQGNENITLQHLWDIAKGLLMGNFIVIKALLEKKHLK